MSHRHDKTRLEVASEILGSKKKFGRIIAILFMILFFSTIIFVAGFYTGSIKINISKDAKKIQQGAE